MVIKRRGMHGRVLTKSVGFKVLMVIKFKGMRALCAETLKREDLKEGVGRNNHDWAF